MSMTEKQAAWFDWLCNMIDGYPDTLSLKTMVRLRDQGERPLIELEPTDHPLAIEQRDGITPARAAELYAFHMRGHHH